MSQLNTFIYCVFSIKVLQLFNVIGLLNKNIGFYFVSFLLKRLASLLLLNVALLHRPIGICAKNY